MNTEIISHTQCTLGEGAFWHPDRNQFFWFDILGKKLLTINDGKEEFWQFDECVSAAGWIDKIHLIIASETGLWNFDISTGERKLLVELEAASQITRSNDGRADPQGGFWIGTMSFNAEKGAGSIYRFYRGEIRKLYSDITISNAICFSPDGKYACYTDTIDNRIMRQLLDEEGWPSGPPEIYLNFQNEEFGADGAIIDSDGNFWNAQWGASRVACYNPAGELIDEFKVSTPQASCPCLGGPDLSTLYITSAAEGLVDNPDAGKTFAIKTSARGQREHQVIM